MNLILASIGVFLGIILLLVVILLVAKQYLTPSGKVKITINGEKELEVEQGSTLLNTLSVNGIYLSSACGGKGSCGQCKCQVVEGGGEILPSEKGHFSRKQQQDHWRLGCQVKVKGDLGIKIDESVLGVKEWECEVISNKNVATFIKEFIVALPKGEHMDFVPGSYAQIKIPKFEMDYNKDIDKDLIGPEYLPAWEKFGLFGLKCKNTEETIRAYSMANYPAEGDRIMLTVRIATPPFKPKDQGPGFMDVNPGIASSYIFTLKPGDKVTMSGPYGDFHPIFDSKKEMMWIGGGAQSTAGGVKVNAFAVVVLNLVAVLRGSERVEVFGRELSHDSIRRSNATVVMSLGVLFLFIFILSILEPKASLLALTFECVSALSTVGSSLNLTPQLCDASKLLVSLLMFIGRVGLITLMLGIVKQKKNTKYRYPSDNIIIN